MDLRWVVLHLIEEISRHNGHLDVVRELVDGQTGVQMIDSKGVGLMSRGRRMRRGDRPITR